MFWNFILLIWLIICTSILVHLFYLNYLQASCHLQVEAGHDKSQGNASNWHRLSARHWQLFLELMINVPTHGLYLGHYMPPTLWKSPEIEDTQKNVIKKYIFKNLKKILIIYIYNYISHKKKMRTTLFRNESWDSLLRQLSCLLLSCFLVKQVQKSRPQTVELTQKYRSEFTTSAQLPLLSIYKPGLQGGELCGGRTYDCGYHQMD